MNAFIGLALYEKKTFKTQLNILNNTVIHRTAFMAGYSNPNIDYLEIMNAGAELFEEQLARYSADIQRLNDYFFEERERIAAQQKYASQQKFKPIYLRLEIEKQIYGDWPRARLTWCVGRKVTRKDGSVYWKSQRIPCAHPDGNYRAKDITAMTRKRGWYYQLVRAVEKEVQPIRRHIQEMHDIYKTIASSSDYQVIRTKNFFNYVPDEQ